MGEGARRASGTREGRPNSWLGRALAARPSRVDCHRNAFGNGRNGRHASRHATRAHSRRLARGVSRSTTLEITDVGGG